MFFLNVGAHVAPRVAPLVGAHVVLPIEAHVAAQQENDVSADPRIVAAVRHQGFCITKFILAFNDICR